ncbi:MJ0042-type zinc finger domain-containing protein [Aeoliella mucimassa]|uniref:Zinc finger/thioredoxin putative domain-containing protein n=1 Tax=Aeoliella mucimassa TaxID=2527972 RepID=A0A518ASL6_9BACT|nr:MJ0042-type zinc finger domain-containing protein [Aeoliella mucimassa]QDU57677.1 hypothetical protein Pan181_38970 [Aeoliella mucimassa]
MSDSTITTQCPHCRTRFKVDLRHVGRQARCPNCKAGFEVHAVAEPTSKPSGPTFVGVNCRLCGTRLYGRHDQVGQLLTCPDCNTKTKLPAPKPKEPTKMPAAMLGQQYELWDGDSQPWGTELLKQQKALVPVRCEVCETLQYVEPAMIGQAIECPDCGHATVVKAPKPKLPPAPAEPDLEVEEVRVDESFAPSMPPIYSRYEDFESLSPEEQLAAMNRVVTNRKSRPQMNAWPLLTGWKAFLTGPGVVSRCLSIGILLAFFFTVAVWVYPMILSGYGAVVGLPIMVATAAMIMLGLASASACAIKVVTESSEGNDRIEEWPVNNPVDWMGESFYMAIGVMSSGILGYLIAWASGADVAGKLLGIAASMWVCFPVVHLSTLEALSPWSLLMPGVLRSMTKSAGSWLQFYLLSAIVVGLFVGTVMLLNRYSPELISLAAIPFMIAGMFYFRMLGRLAWRIRHDGDS